MLNNKKDIVKELNRLGYKLDINIGVFLSLLLLDSEDYANIIENNLFSNLPFEDILNIFKFAKKIMEDIDEPTKDKFDKETRIYSKYTDKQFFNFLDKELKTIDSLSEIDTQVFEETTENWNKFAIYLDAFISQQNDYSLDSIEVTSDQFGPIFENIRTLISESFGILKHDDVFKNLSYLSETGHRGYYKTFGECTNISDLYFDGITSKEKEGINRAFTFAKNYMDKYKPFMLLGWDISRYIDAYRSCYYLGYISLEETQLALKSAAQFTISNFRSWKEFAKSFVFGHAFWLRYSGNDFWHMCLKKDLKTIKNCLTPKSSNSKKKYGGEWDSFPFPANTVTDYEI